MSLLTASRTAGKLSAMHLYVDYPSFLSPYIIPSLGIRWYSVMYLVAFTVAYLVMRLERRKGLISISDDDMYSLFVWGIGMLLLGARLGSVLIYNDDRLYYLLHPWMIFWPFENGQFVGLPGMSFHGGVVGGVTGIFIFCRRSQKKARLAAQKLRGRKKEKAFKGYGFFQITDVFLPAIALGYTFGRIGNFLNLELYGRVTDSPIGMIFPQAGKLSTSLEWVREIADKVGISYTAGEYLNLPRYPSQLFEAFFEGVLLFVILWFFIGPLARRKRPDRPGMISGWWLILYGVFRFFIEYLREPDSNLGYVISLGNSDGPIELFESMLNFSMGQILCAMMIIAGILMIVLTGHRKDLQGDIK